MSGTLVPEFTGWAAMNAEKGKALDCEPWTFGKEPKSQIQPTDDTVDIKVECCGMCATDKHMLRQEWPLPAYPWPMIAGHEIIGKVVQAGKNTGLAVGQRVGVGYQGGSCLSCKYCDKHIESYCKQERCVYAAPSPPDGAISQGGYADHVRCQGRFAIPIPEKLESTSAAPLMCAGVTVYSPLKRFGVGPGKKVAIAGIGGLGHIAAQMSIAMGADTYVLSQSDSKLELAKKLGVKPENYIATNKGYEALSKEWESTFDVILVTANFGAPPLTEFYFPITAPLGAIVLVALPEDKINEFHPFSLVGKGLVLAGSLIGGSDELRETLELAEKGHVKPMVEVRPMSEVSQALKDLVAGKPRFRYVLKNE